MSGPVRVGFAGSYKAEMKALDLGGDVCSLCFGGTLAFAAAVHRCTFPHCGRTIRGRAVYHTSKHHPTHVVGLALST